MYSFSLLQTHHVLLIFSSPAVLIAYLKHSLLNLDSGYLLENRTYLRRNTENQQNMVSLGCGLGGERWICLLFKKLRPNLTIFSSR